MRIDVNMCVHDFVSVRQPDTSPLEHELVQPNSDRCTDNIRSLNRLCFFVCSSGVAIAFFVIGTLVVLKTSLVPAHCSETNTASPFHFLQRCPALCVSSFVHYYKLI